MAYQFADGFDHYSTLSELWETTSGTCTIGTAYRRFAPPSGLPGQGLYTSGYARKNLLSNQATLIPKVSFYATALPPTSAEIFGLYDGTESQVAICITAAGAIAVYTGWAHVGGNILIGSTGPGLVSANQWHGIEALITIGSSGSVEIWLDGAQVLSISGVNTQFSSNAFANQLQVNDGTVPVYFDDVRVWDTSGTTQNAPLGASLQDSRLITKLPSGAGAYAQFTPNGASANWQCVDDNPPDGDTSYVSGSSAGLMDAYDAPTAGFSAAPAMVLARAYARKDDAGTRQLAVGVDSGGHTAVGPTATLGSSYAFVDGCITEDPNTSAAWTAVGADGAQILIEEIA